MQFICHYCFQANELEIYLEDGAHQDFILDCEVCCHPLRLLANWDEEEGSFSLEVEAGLE